MKRPGKLISVSPIHFKKYLDHYKDVLTETFEDYETGFVSDLLELYAQSPFLLKYALLSLIKESVLDSGKVVEFLVRKLFSEESELFAVIVEVLDDIIAVYAVQQKLESLMKIKDALYKDVAVSHWEKSLLHKKTLEFLFGN